MLNLERNVGDLDKNIRIGVGAVLLLIGLITKSFLIVLIGLIVLATGVLSFCGLYRLIGMNTATKAEQATANPDLVKRASENVEDFKQDVTEAAHEAKGKATQFVDEHRDEAEALVDSAKKKASEVAQDLKEEVAELKDDAEELVDAAKKKIHDATQKKA